MYYCQHHVIGSLSCETISKASPAEYSQAAIFVLFMDIAFLWTLRSPLQAGKLWLNTNSSSQLEEAYVNTDVGMTVISGPANQIFGIINTNQMLNTHSRSRLEILESSSRYFIFYPGEVVVGT